MNANCKPHYKDAGVPLPEDIVTSMTVTLRKIRNAAKNNVKDDTRNVVANAARSDLRKKGKDPNYYMDEAEQVAFEKDRASIDKDTAKETELRKRDADPKQILDEADQARMKKLKVLDDKSNAKITDLRKRYADPNRFWTKPIKQG